MKEATTTAKKPQFEDIHLITGMEDTWEMNSGKGQVVRFHNVPCRTRFSPIQVPGCPWTSAIWGWRVSFAKFSFGETWHEKDFWPGTRGYAALDQPWTGKTILEVTGM